MQATQAAPSGHSGSVCDFYNVIQQAIITFTDRVYDLAIAIFTKIQNAPYEVQEFFKSFDHPSSIETAKRSKLHDATRYKSWGDLNNAALWHENSNLETLLQTHDVNEKDIDGATALHAAALSGNWRAVKILLDRGALIDATEIRGQTALHWAAHRGHVVTVNYLLKRGANIDAKDLRDKTPLRMAAKYGHLETVSCLHAQGANLNAQDAKKQTPYFVALLHGRNSVGMYLEEVGADTEVVNIDGKVAWDVAGRAGGVAFFRRLGVPDFFLSILPTPFLVSTFISAIIGIPIALVIDEKLNR